MSQFTTVGLNPAARPVDTFVAPDVRRETGGDDLLQIGKALQDLAPGLGRFIQAREQVVSTQETQRALETITKRQLENRAQFAELVQRGEIDRADNPYFAKAAGEILTKKEFRSAFDTWSREYEQNRSLRQSKDISGSDVRKFLSERTKQFAETLDSNGVLAIAEDSARGIDEFVSRHVARRKQEMDKEIVSDASTQISKRAAEAFAANQASGDDMAVFDPERIGEIQGLADRLYTDAGYTPAQVAKIVSESIFAGLSSADDAGAVDAMRVTLAAVKVGDKTVTELLPPLDFKKLEDDIERRQFDRFRMEQQRDAMVREKRVRDALNGKYDAGKLDTSDRLALRKLQGQIELDDQEGKANAIIRKMVDLADGRELSQEDLKEARLGLIAIGLPPSMAMNYLQVLGSLREENEWPRQTDVATFTMLSKYLIDPSISDEEKIGRLVDLARAKVISKDDYEQAFNRLQSGTREGARADSNAMQIVASSAEDAIRNSGLTNLVTFGLQEGEVNLTQEGQSVLRNVQDALYQAEESLRNRQDYRSMSYAEKREHFNRAVEQVFKERGIPTKQELERRSLEERTFRNAVAQTPEGAAIPEPVRTSVRFVDGSFVGPGGAPLPPKALPFPVEDLRSRSIADIAKGMGAAGDAEAAQMLRALRERMTPEQRRQVGVWQSVLEATKGDSVVKKDEQISDFVDDKGSMISPDDRRALFSARLKNLSEMVSVRPITAKQTGEEILRSLKRTLDRVEAGTFGYVTDPVSGLVYTSGDPAAVEEIKQDVAFMADALAGIDAKVFDFRAKQYSQDGFWNWFNREVALRSGSSDTRGLSDAARSIRSERNKKTQQNQEQQNAASAQQEANQLLGR